MFSIFVLYLSGTAQDHCSLKLNQPIATVGGETIYEDEFPPLVAGQLEYLRHQEFELEKKSLDELIRQRLLDAEAKKKEITADKLLEMEVDAKIVDPTVEEVEKYYRAQKQHISQPFDEAKANLRETLKRSKIQATREDYLDLLQHEAEVAVFLRPPRVEVNYDSTRLRGSPNASVTIVEFSDYNCPFCRQAESTLKEIATKYRGKVRLAYRDFPLREKHLHAQLAAEASRCAGEQGKFWDYHDLLFDNPGNFAREELIEVAEQVHLHPQQFDSCLSSGKYKSHVNQDVQDGLRAGVFGTPGFFINGIFLAGAQPVAEFEKIIDEELETAKRTAHENDTRHSRSCD